MAEHSNWRGKVLAAVIIVIAAVLLVYGIRLYDQSKDPGPAATQVTVESERPTESQPASADVSEPTESNNPEKQVKLERQALADKYADLGMIDVHNHDASKYLLSFPTWDRYHVSKIVLFGNVSEPSAKITDALAWGAYRAYPDRIYPFFSGFDMNEPEGLQTVRNQLENGYLGVGETVAASTHSPVVSKVIWKANDPMDGNLPKVYELIAEYDAPILLHIDPPNGLPVQKLEEALEQYPDTLFIFGHANVYQDADSIGKLLKAHPNLYIDFCAGFTSYNPSSPYKTETYIDLIEQYPDRFFLSTDGAFDMTYDEAIPAMYETIDLLKPETRKKVASGNFQRIINAQRPTKTQLERLEKLGGGKEAGVDPATLSRHEMNKLLFKLAPSA